MTFGESAPRRVRIWERMRLSLLPDAVVSGSRYGRLWEQIRSSLGADTDAPAPAFVNNYRERIVRQADSRVFP